MKYILQGLFLALILNQQSIASSLPIEYFSKRAEFADVKISPNGDYVSAITDKEGKNVLAIFDRKTFKLQHAVFFKDNAQVGDYHWVNNERVVLQKQYIRGFSDQPQFYGELFAVNANGKKAKYLMGYNAGQQTGSNIKKNKSILGISYVLDPLVNDDKYMLAATYPWGNSKGAEPYVTVYKVNLYSGKKKKVTRSPARMASYLTDNNGEVRFSVSSSDYVNQELYIRDLASGDWQKLTQFDGKLTNLTPYAFDKSGENIYALANIDKGPKGLFKIDLASAKYELIAKDDTVDPSNVWINRATKNLYAVEFEAGYPTYEFVDKSSPMTKALKDLLGALPGHQVRIVSRTLAGDINIIWAGNDRTPGNYYLFDTQKNNLTFLLSAKSWIKPEQMAEVKPISFKARDGLTIHGYLTLPAHKEAKNLPLVVMPHGGPHGPRDWWGFDAKSQLLANHGMAVLQINFRGSGGYGTGFEHAGHRKWGKEIQYDIIDGVKYVNDQGIANKDNMCIMGGSFGGYSALQSAILEPDMFKCSVGEFGVYSLPLMFEEGDVQERSSGQKYLARVLGDDEEQLKAFSPVFNIDKLKAPVLIVHGAKDRRAPIEQAEALIAALEDQDHPFEYFELKAAGHGVYSNNDRTTYFKKVLEFLKKHLDT